MIKSKPRPLFCLVLVGATLVSLVCHSGCGTAPQTEYERGYNAGKWAMRELRETPGWVAPGSLKAINYKSAHDDWDSRSADWQAGAKKGWDDEYSR
ncbi:MAG: hypothetical protein ACI9HK_003211 [Pirellulaceae bacterium]|jgi:hypothetical protein